MLRSPDEETLKKQASLDNAPADPTRPAPACAVRDFEAESRKTGPRLEIDSSASIDESLTQLIDGLPDAVILLDQQWRIVYANETARSVSRIHPESLNRGSLWELYPELTGTLLERAYRETMELREIRRIGAFYYEPFGTWYDLCILPSKCGVAVHYRDITVIREAEMARDLAAAQTAQVLDATTDSVICLDRDWRIVYMNGRAREMLSPRGEVMGTNLWESFPDAVYEGSPFLDNYRLVMEEGISREFEAYYAAPLNLWLHVMAYPSNDGIIIFFRDVTQQKRATASLLQTEKLAAVGRLASSIAHEINNPLESVTNLIYLARTHAENADTQKFLETAEQELRRVSIIANQTLRFHKQASRPQSIGCAELFSTVLDIYQGKLKNSNIQIEKRKCAHQPVVCFEGEIRQVLNNLVGNAIDAMPTGGRLLVRSRDGTDWKTGRPGLILTVADTGSGMDPQTRARAFEAFFTTKGESGTGLGLWVSEKIVKRHHGVLRVRSSRREGHKGTAITLFLPWDGMTVDGDSPCPTG